MKLIAGVNISNVNDTIEFQAVKPVTHNDSLTNLKERHLKDISITVDGTNIINKEKSTKDVLQIKSSKLCLLNVSVNFSFITVFFNSLMPQKLCIYFVYCL